MVITAKDEKEICETENSSVVKFTGYNNRKKNDLVLHTNCVRECIKSGQLIDLNNSNGENFGTKIKTNEMLLLVDNQFRMQVEHSYARVEPVQRQLVNTSIEINETSHPEQENSNETSPTIDPLEIIIFRRWADGPKNNSPVAKQNSPKSETKRINLSSETVKEAEDSQLQICKEIDKSFDQIENMPLYERLQGLKTSEKIIPDRSESPIIGARMLRRKPHIKRRVIINQPINCSSRISLSPTILRDKFNQVKILGEGYKEPVNNIEKSHCTFSKSLNQDTSVTCIDKSRVEKNISASDKDTSSEDKSTTSTSKKSTGWIERRNLNRDENKSRLLTRNFTRWEECEMVKYLIDNQYINDAKGNLVWQKMRKDGWLQHRTYYSLNNHFRRYILPRIHQFSMNPKYLRKFRRLQNTKRIRME